MRKYTRGEFIILSKRIHNNKYDYSLTEYNNSHEKVIIRCFKHGIFKQMPYVHLQGRGCKECGRDTCASKMNLTTEEFIEKANKIHNCSYDYSKIEYKNYKSKVIIICKKHGEFKQSAASHLNVSRRPFGGKCPYCTREILKNKIRKLWITTQNFIDKAKKIHNSKYDYSLVEYKGCNNKVKIICPEHGCFEQKARLHLEKHGCKYCRKKKYKKRNIKLISNTKEYTKNE